MTTNPTKFQMPTVENIKIDLIDHRPELNSRTVVDGKAVEELATSMKREGLLQPVRVEKIAENKYRLVFGFRRLQAAQFLKWDVIRAEVVPAMSPDDRLVANLLENLGRENLSTYDQAVAFSKLQKEYGMSGTNIGHSVGKSVPYVNNLIRIVEGLHPTIIERWKQECQPGFGRDADTGKKLANVHAVCTGDWLGKLVARVPQAEQEYELKVALGLIDPDAENEGDGEGGDDEGEGGQPRTVDAPKRATMKQLEAALKYAEKMGKETKGEEGVAAKAVVAALKFAMGKSQTIKPIKYKPSEANPDGEKN